MRCGEQSLCQVWVEILLRRFEFCRGEQQASHERVDPSLLDEPPWREERPVKRQRALWNGVEGGIEAIQYWVDERVTKAERGCGERIWNSWVHLWLVALVRSKFLHSLSAKNVRQPVGVSDVLHLRPYNLKYNVFSAASLHSKDTLIVVGL